MNDQLNHIKTDLQPAAQKAVGRELKRWLVGRRTRAPVRWLPFTRELEFKNDSGESFFGLSS